MPKSEVYDMSELSSIISKKEKDIELNNKRKESISKELDKLDEDYANNLISVSDYDAKKDELENSIKEMDARLATLQQSLDAYRRIEELDKKEEKTEEVKPIIEPIQSSYAQYKQRIQSEKDLDYNLTQLENQNNFAQEDRKINVETIKQAMQTHNEDDIANAIFQTNNNVNNSMYISNINDYLREMMVNYTGQTYEEYLDKKNALSDIDYNIKLIETQNSFVDDEYKINIDSLKKALNTKNIDDIMVAMADLEKLADAKNMYGTNIFNDMQKVFFKNNSIINNITNNTSVKANDVKDDQQDLKNVVDNNPVVDNNEPDLTAATDSNNNDNDGPDLSGPTNPDNNDNDGPDLTGPAASNNNDNDGPDLTGPTVSNNTNYGNRTEPHLATAMPKAQSSTTSSNPNPSTTNDETIIVNEIIRLITAKKAKLDVHLFNGIENYNNNTYNSNAKLLSDNGLLYLEKEEKSNNKAILHYIVNYPKIARFIADNKDKFTDSMLDEAIDLIDYSIIAKLTYSNKWGDKITQDMIADAIKVFTPEFAQLESEEDKNEIAQGRLDSLKYKKAINKDDRFAVNPPINTFVKLVDNKKADLKIELNKGENLSNTKLKLDTGKEIEDIQRLVDMRILLLEKQKQDGDKQVCNFIVNYPKMYTTLKKALPGDDPRLNNLGSLNIDAYIAKLGYEVVWSEEVTSDLIDNISAYFGVIAPADTILEELRNRNVLTQGNKFTLNEPAIKPLRGRIPSKFSGAADFVVLNVGENKRLYPEVGENQSARWVVEDDKSILSFNNDVITANKTGKARIKLIVDGHVKKTWEVDIRQKEHDFDDESRNLGSSSGLDMNNAKALNKYDDSSKKAIHDPNLNPTLLDRFMAIKQVKSAKSSIAKKVSAIRDGFAKYVNVPDVTPDASYFAQSMGASIFGLNSENADKMVERMVSERTDISEHGMGRRA